MEGRGEERREGKGIGIKDRKLRRTERGTQGMERNRSRGTQGIVNGRGIGRDRERNRRGTEEEQKE
jgi:hypothetical protein